MNIPSTIINKLEIFDSIPFQPLLESEVYNTIQKELPVGTTEHTLEEYAELIAFRLLETSKGDIHRWGTYYKPLITSINEDGIITDFPSLSQITPKTIEYWFKRSNEAKHPVLIARYSGLVYDFSKIISANLPVFPSAKLYVESLLNTVSLNLHKVAVYGIGKIQRALKVAISLNNRELINKVKSSIFCYENSVPHNETRNLWGVAYDSFITANPHLVNTAEREKIISQLEQRLSILSTLDSEATNAVVERLADYYKSHNSIDEVKRVLKVLYSSFVKTIEGTSYHQQAHYIERLYRLYKKYNLKDETEQTLIWLREVNRNTDEELKKVASEWGIEKDDIDKFVDGVLKADSETTLLRIVSYFVPNYEQEKKRVIEMFKQAPLQFLISTSLVDKKGRKIVEIKPVENENYDDHILLSLSRALSIQSFELHFVLKEGISREIVTVNEIMKFLKKSCIIDKSRYHIIETGIKAYFNEDYLVFIHLLIPQFEEAIRNLIEGNGGNVLVQKDTSYNLKTFDHILQDKIVQDVFGSDLALYFRILFTDKRGWNLRNNVAHGLSDEEEFDKQRSDRLLHAFLCLGMVRIKEDKNPPDINVAK